MANFQECANLKVGDEYQTLCNLGQDSLNYLFFMQKSLQENLFKHDFDKIKSKLSKLKEFIDWNEEAIRDEDREFQQALTGIHTYPGCWKPWKSKHKEAMDRSLSDLTENELKELHYEWIDKLHFMLNIAIAIGLTPEKITNYYCAKNRENIDRQNRGNY
jgi:hypothetical protein